LRQDAFTAWTDPNSQITQPDMSLIEIHTELEYQLNSDCSFYFSILVARTDRQKVLKERLRIEPDHAVEHLPYGSGGHQLMRLSAPPGNLKIG
jgi:hypothetical protein